MTLEMFTERQGCLVPTFSGITYEEKHDKVRLGLQFKKVKELMDDHKWRTLREISESTQAPEASISARLRDLRKLGYTVERRRRGDPGRGIHEYRILSENR